jgi:hypothetical protein
MISERTLRNWRRDALNGRPSFPCEVDGTILNIEHAVVVESCIGQLNERVLRLTQELMDLYLVKKG